MNLIITVLLLILVESCKKDNKKVEAEFFASSITKTHIKDSVKWIVILPGLGCTGCIQEAELFMQENVGNKEILFVLTKIESLKILQKKINITIKEHSNIYIDRERIFDIPTYNTIYPCIVQLEGGKIKTHEFQSPKNSTAFRNLKKQLLLAQSM